MKIKVTRNIWSASYGFAIILHPYPKHWEWDILIGNRNFTVYKKPRRDPDEWLRIYNNAHRGT